MNSEKPPPNRFDSVYRNARNEASVILFVLASLLVWTVGYCYADGYYLTGDEITTFWGFPNWIFFGVMVPWGAATLFSIVFGWLFMADDDLGKEADSHEPEHREGGQHE